MNLPNHTEEIKKRLETIPPDTYNSSGINVSELLQDEKDFVLTILRNEFIPN